MMNWKKLRIFIVNAIIPYRRNPGWNVTAFITLVGLGVWGICALGNAFGFATFPASVSEIGSMIFGYGLGVAKNQGEHK